MVERRQVPSPRSALRVLRLQTPLPLRRRRARVTKTGRHDGVFGPGPLGPSGVVRASSGRRQSSRRRRSQGTLRPRLSEVVPAPLRCLGTFNHGGSANRVDLGLCPVPQAPHGPVGLPQRGSRSRHRARHSRSHPPSCCGGCHAQARGVHHNRVAGPVPPKRFGAESQIQRQGLRDRDGGGARSGNALRGDRFRARGHRSRFAVGCLDRLRQRTVEHVYVLRQLQSTLR
mmetsp:Transcript_4394/g.10365  ORF Transcript_4394/g.10365 Transcript_4394/m.10365 type:complete len:229 (-) Transcript_4394:897-1583(-)